MTKDLEEKETSEEETPESPSQEEKETPKEKTEEPSKDKVEEPAKVDRLPRTFEATVPKGRFDKEREKVREKESRITDLENQIKELSLKAITGDLDQQVRSIAEEAGIDADVITKLARAIRGNVGVSDEVKKEIEELKERVYSSIQDSGFEREFSQLIKDNPEANTPEAREKLRNLAFTEEFARVPLSVIFYGHPGEFAKANKSKTAEPSRGGTSMGGEKDWKNMAFQEIMDLPGDEKGKIIAEMSEQDPKKYEEFTAWLSSQSGPRIIRA